MRRLDGNWWRAGTGGQGWGRWVDGDAPSTAAFNDGPGSRYSTDSEGRSGLNDVVKGMELADLGELGGRQR